jgi:hypothetical protein
MPMARPTKQDDQAGEVAVADRNAGEPGGDAGREQDGVGQRRREPPPLWGLLHRVGADLLVDNCDPFLHLSLASAFHEGVAVAVLVAVGRGGGVVAAAPACLGSASVLLSPSPGRGGVWLGSLDWPGTGR